MSEMWCEQGREVGLYMVCRMRTEYRGRNFKIPIEKRVGLLKPSIITVRSRLYLSFKRPLNHPPIGRSAHLTR